MSTDQSKALQSKTSVKHRAKLHYKNRLKSMRNKEVWIIRKTRSILGAKAKWCPLMCHKASHTICISLAPTVLLSSDAQLKLWDLQNSIKKDALYNVLYRPSFLFCSTMVSGKRLWLRECWDAVMIENALRDCSATNMCAVLRTIYHRKRPKACTTKVTYRLNSTATNLSFAALMSRCMSDLLNDIKHTSHSLLRHKMLKHIVILDTTMIVHRRGCQRGSVLHITVQYYLRHSYWDHVQFKGQSHFAPAYNLFIGLWDE